MFISHDNPLMKHTFDSSTRNQDEAARLVASQEATAVDQKDNKLLLDSPNKAKNPIEFEMESNKPLKAATDERVSEAP